MATSTTIGYPRIGRDRELKRACEAYWRHELDIHGLRSTAKQLRQTHWQAQQAAGIDLIPVNDFSYYDGVLDAIALVGAVPERYHWSGDTVDEDTLFAMARGRQDATIDVTAMEMTKWFDTNYHYIVPEWSANQILKLSSAKPIDEFQEARALGINAKPTLVGPLTLALSGKTIGDVDILGALLDNITAVYVQIVEQLAAAGATWIAFDEPCLVQDRTSEELAALNRIYTNLAQHKGSARLMLQTYFGHLGDSFNDVVALPVDGIGLDIARGAPNVEYLRLNGVSDDKVVSIGIVDGRNVWRTDFHEALLALRDIATVVPSDRLQVSTSCSLLHVPYSAERETGIAAAIRPWLAFAEEKLVEVVNLTNGLNGGDAVISDALQANAGSVASRKSSPLVHNQAIKLRLAGEQRIERAPYVERKAAQAQSLKLDILPTTTIGSFPQTAEVRRQRHLFDTGELTAEDYDTFLREETARTIRIQEDIGLDVLVHGEYERNDMVQYFGELLSGFTFTAYGWVQSYGSRCVRPPIIFGDIERPLPMTVKWSSYAQSLTERPVKGMLTGPVTILNWSFVRDDQPRSVTCQQIAFALKDEVADLQSAGLKVIQVDEPALREGLPLRRSDWAQYLGWAVNSFRLSASSAGAQTQIHTHMCYSAFDDIIDAISGLDADVLSIENSRSGGDMLGIFKRTGYDKAVGPGVYDIHSPRVPSVAEMTSMITATVDVLSLEQVWVNPDCGLKTRAWPEVTAALTNMVEAAREARRAMQVESRAE